jgi:hypothetical protein
VTVPSQLQQGESSGKQHLPGSALRGMLLPLLQANASARHPQQQQRSAVSQLQQTCSNVAASLQLQQRQRRLLLLLARLLLLLRRLLALHMMRARVPL